MCIDGRKYTLIPIVVRGGGYESEWANNMLIGSVGNHRGFDNAARVVKNFVDNYINDTEGRVVDDQAVERLVPVIDDVVIDVDLDNDLVYIRPLEGLFYD